MRIRQSATLNFEWRHLESTFSRSGYESSWNLNLQFILRLANIFIPSVISVCGSAKRHWKEMNTIQILRTTTPTRFNYAMRSAQRLLRFVSNCVAIMPMKKIALVMKWLALASLWNPRYQIGCPIYTWPHGDSILAIQPQKQKIWACAR